jgi:transposase, IS5 family
MAGRPGFFDLDERHLALSAARDPLERLAVVVDFELFRQDLELALDRSDRAKGGRPPYDPVLMFKVLVLQSLYTLSDDQTEYQIRDRLSFMRFLGLALEDRVPDAKTVWLFREQLTKAGVVERLFARFEAVLRGAGYLAMSGQIVDATVVEARRPRLAADEKATVKAGGVPEGWSAAKRAQMDTDGRWTIKRGRKRKRSEGEPQARVVPEITVPVFGYKNHIGIDRRFGFIRCFSVTDAAAHDGGQLHRLLDPDNTARGVWADTAYRSAAKHQAPGPARAGGPSPTSEAQRQADVDEHPPRQREARQGARRGRACLRRPEMPPPPGHPLHWPRPGHHQARARQPGQQHEASRLARDPSRPRLRLDPSSRAGALDAEMASIHPLRGSPFGPTNPGTALYLPENTVLRSVRVPMCGIYAFKICTRYPAEANQCRSRTINRSWSPCCAKRLKGRLGFGI